MKSNVKPVEKPFKPLEVTIVLENQDELDRFYAMCRLIYKTPGMETLVDALANAGAASRRIYGKRNEGGSRFCITVADIEGDTEV